MSTPARHIESVIPMPFSTSPTQSRPRLPSQAWSSRNTSGSIGIPYGVRGSSSVISTSPTRSTSRSFPHPSALSGRGTASPYTPYEPRVIRVDSTFTTDILCPRDSPTTSSGSPTRTRRQSSTGVRARSTQRPSATLIPPATTEPLPFPRPAYLEHSALRHLLQTESSPLISSRKPDPIVRPDSTSGRHMQRSPSYDSDDDDMSPPREIPKGTPSPITASSPALLLPTRWCDEYRSSHLTVSGDGRELIYQGMFPLRLCSEMPLSPWSIRRFRQGRRSSSYRRSSLACLRNILLRSRNHQQSVQEVHSLLIFTLRSFSSFSHSRISVGFATPLLTDTELITHNPQFHRA